MTGSSRKRDWQVRLAALAIFLLGFAAGALSLTVYDQLQAGGHESRGKFSEIFDELELTEGQRERVDVILGDARAEIEAIRKEEAAQFQQMRERVDVRLEDVLTPEQLVEFKRLRAEWLERRDGHDKGGRGK
jgi:Spy/CpxP family protein refolding chaperone